MYGSYGFYEAVDAAAYGDATKKCNKILKDLEKQRANQGKRQRWPGYRQNKISKLKSKYTQNDCENVLPNGAALLSPKLAKDLKNAGIDTVDNGSKDSGGKAPGSKPRINLLGMGGGGGKPRAGLVAPGTDMETSEATGMQRWVVGILAVGTMGLVYRWWRAR
tara:strand:+ start:162 stop:650 length:489 start_codon:yes stop_codon:yes gene_type:complete